MKQAFCQWCHTPVKVRDTYDDTKNKVVCSRGCRDAETLFTIHFSDEAIHRRAHYKELTGGDNEGEAT